MNQINNLTDQADQLTRLILADGSLVNVELIFTAATARWIMNVTWPAPPAGSITLPEGTFQANGIGIAVMPNLLRQWREVIPFGIACLTTDGADPVNVDDFITGRAQLYLLSETDVAAVETGVFT